VVDRSSGSGLNSGAHAGQAFFHVDVHFIPRRDGDVAEPRGGVRGLLTRKQRY
jgi:ATP adenylyltransferase